MHFPFEHAHRSKATALQLPFTVALLRNSLADSNTTDLGEETSDFGVMSYIAFGWFNWAIMSFLMFVIVSDTAMPSRTLSSPRFPRRARRRSAHSIGTPLLKTRCGNVD